MAVKRAFVCIISMLATVACILSISASAAYEYISDEKNEYYSKVNLSGSLSNAAIPFKNQGYRITLLDKNNKPLYILDLVNRDPGYIYTGSPCAGSYGFDRDLEFDLGNHELDEIFNGCIRESTDYYGNYGSFDPVEEFESIHFGERIVGPNGYYTEDYIIKDGIHTVNTVANTQNSLFAVMQEIKGQCKLYYVQNENKRYLDDGYSVTGSNFIDPSLKIGTFYNDYRCDNKTRMTVAEFNAEFETNIPEIKDDFSGEQFFFLERTKVDPYTGLVDTTACFYERPYINDARFLNALYLCFMKRMGSSFDVNSISDYSLMFEPIVWTITGTNGYYEVHSNQNGWDGGWAGRHTGKLYAPVEGGTEPLFAFYGTLTELSFIQMECTENNNNWRQVIGFPTKDFWRIHNAVVYDLGGILYNFVDICNDNGAAMMLRNESINIQGTTIKTSKDFANDIWSGALKHNSYYTEILQGSSYVVNNMAVALLKYHPPITYLAKNYEYRTDTEVVTSIKLTNNNASDFLPTYGSVAQYESAPAEYAEEPVAIGAILEYTDESGNALSSEFIADAGLPDFVSVQGIGASQNFDSQRSSGFESTPSNEVYLYFKWKTPSTPQKINVTARFVGDNNKNPIYIDNSMGSIAGEVLEYNGSDPNYSGKSFTTVTFSCDVKDTVTQLDNSNVPPDTIGGFMDKPSASASAAEIENYNKNSEVFSKYNEYYNINGVHKQFDMKEYLAEPDSEPDRAERLNWFEYTSYIDYTDNQVKLELHEYRANSWLQPQEYTSEWVTSPFKPVVIHDNVPNYNKEVSAGRYLPCIPSGYGFSFAYTEDYTGNNGIIVTEEYMENIKNSCTMFQNGVMLFPEFNYSTDHVRTIETAFDYDENDSTFDCVHALAVNQNSKYKDSAPAIEDVVGIEDLYSRVHFIPVWFPDKTEYKIEVIMFDYWTPAGQIYDHETYTLYIDGNIYNNWYAVKSDRNQKK